MKKWLTIFLLIPTLSIAKPNAPWETVTSPSNNSSVIYRMLVPHGWLVYVNPSYSPQVTFVPDENHEWILENK